MMGRLSERSTADREAQIGSYQRRVRLRARGTQSFPRPVRTCQSASRRRTDLCRSGCGNGRRLFYSLAVGEVAYDDAPGRLSKGLARHPVPIMLLARLAVSNAWQGRGLGAGLLKDAMRRAIQAADIARIRAFAVHAKDEPALRFYEHFGFIASPTDLLHLFLLIKDIRRIARP